jgi:peptide/nickel transport system substrate-binding protein
MMRTVLKSVAALSALALGVAACSSSTSSGSGNSNKAAATTGKTLVIESTPLSPMTDNFNPLSSTSTGYVTNSTALYNEPLYIFNNVRPTQAPIPILASGAPTWSNGGKTVTIPVRAGVKWNDGKPFTASDVAFTFNMIKSHPALYTSGAPTVTSATATSATSVTLNFAKPEYANLFLIGQVYIEPQHVWSTVSNPVTYADPSPVDTGPYMLDKFSPQGYTLKINPLYRAKSTLHVPEIDFPSYNTNANLVPPIQSGQIDFAGNYVSDIEGNYLSKSPDNHTWESGPPYFSDNNVVSLFVNTHKAPLNDAAVRQAISYGINRQQLSVQGETGYEPPITTTSGLMLPVDQTFLDPALANNLPAAGSASKVSSTLTADGYKKVNGKWTKNGKTISFSISDPVPYSDYYTDDQLIARQLNALGFDVKVDGIGNPTVWAGDVANGTFDTTIHWSNQGPSPFEYLDEFMDSSLTAPIGKPAGGDFGRFSDPAAQAAINQFSSSASPTVQAAAITKMEQIMNTQVPVIPLLNGGAWGEFSTRNYTGWPTASNPYMVPVPNTPYLEYTVTQLKPAS